MINRTTGEVSFRSGLYFTPHCSLESLAQNVGGGTKVKTHRLSFKGWKRHVFDLHQSEHGTFEVEALAEEDDCIQIVLLAAHQRAFADLKTQGDVEGRAFHEEVIHSDLAGQREFSWGEVVCRLDSRSSKDWLIIAYSREARVLLPAREVVLRLYAHADIPGEQSGQPTEPINRQGRSTRI